MPGPSFAKLNLDWNAEPNAPDPRVSVDGNTAHLRFCLNHMAYAATEGEEGHLAFPDCHMWRLGSTNDEGWHRGQCRYSAYAPAWGEFYELTGPDTLSGPQDWHELAADGRRHFLFYFRDQTFECFAADWHFSRGRADRTG